MMADMNRHFLLETNQKRDHDNDVKIRKHFKTIWKKIIFYRSVMG